MSDLLKHVIDQHGGLDRWSAVSTLTAELTAGGPFWTFKGQADLVAKETLTLDTKRQHLTIAPFQSDGRRSVFDVAPERFTVLDADGAVVEHRDDPRSSFTGYELSSPWDAVQAGYFVSYAMWNYLTAPFLFTYPGVRTREIEPWQENGETWRRLVVTFPATVATHNSHQVFYFGEDGLQRRMDYAPDVTGNPPVAHYTEDYRTFDGISLPTRRTVHARDAHGVADRSLAVITLDISDVVLA